MTFRRRRSLSPLAVKFAAGGGGWPLSQDSEFDFFPSRVLSADSDFFRLGVGPGVDYKSVLSSCPPQAFLPLALALAVIASTTSQAAAVVVLTCCGRKAGQNMTWRNDSMNETSLLEERGEMQSIQDEKSEESDDKKKSHRWSILSSAGGEENEPQLGVWWLR